LITAIDEYVDRHNEAPKPFIWAASVGDILEKVTHMSISVGPFVRRCPKAGRVTGIRRGAVLPRLLLPTAGLLSVLWFLFRVIPKPSRAAYPCQRIAAGLGSGFLVHLTSLLAALAGHHFLRRRGAQIAAAGVGTVLCCTLYVGSAVSDQPKPQVLIPAEGPNHPMGAAKGIYAGRVTWAQDFAATKWNGQDGNWWEDRNVNQAAVDKMISRNLQELTGANSDKSAWDRLFRWHNQAAGRGNQGYKAGERIVVKLNCNADEGKPWNNRGYPSPQVVAALVRQMVEVAGVPGNAVLLSDPSRAIGANIYREVRALPGAEYQQVSYEGQSGEEGPQRVRPEPDMNSPVWFDMPGGKRQALYLPKSFSAATYMINFGLMRPHRVFGVTLAGKNHFGSVYDPELKIFKPSALHAFALWDYPTPNHQGEPHSHPVLMGHRNTGGKTMLYMLDGLYTSYNQGQPVVRWSTLDNRWFSSILMSQDPVALDSVSYDLITSEPNLTRDNPCFNGNADSYLHEAALAGAPPSKAKYDPGNSGKALQSLGVHEHWNSAAAKKYARNLGRGQGVELIELRWRFGKGNHED